MGVRAATQDRPAQAPSCCTMRRGLRYLSYRLQHFCECGHVAFISGHATLDGCTFQACLCSGAGGHASEGKMTVAAQVGRVCVALGHATNNMAEYTGLIRGLQAAHALGVRHLRILGDSKLVVEQVLPPAQGLPCFCGSMGTPSTPCV